VFLGDGCLMEGISHEACALAGTWAWQADRLLGRQRHFHRRPRDGWFTDDTPKRFEAYGWNVVANVDGHDAVALEAAIQKAKQSSDKPTLICCKTIIGKGSPNKEGTHDVHGAPLGNAEIAATRAHIGWNHEPFVIPQDVYAGWDGKTKGEGLEKLWNNKFAAYAAQFPELAAEFTRRMNGDLPADWAGRVQAALATTLEKAETVATRKASQLAIERLVSTLPERVGGSADLTGSNLTNWPGCHSLHRNPGGNYISYGVREFGMSHIMNGMALHGGLFPFGGTFLMFSEYARNALRMSALMKQRVVYVFTHDSIGLGEDGPTHQPVEQTATLRMIPNMTVWRPCDTTETLVAWAASVEKKDGPSCHILSRQNLPFIKRSDAQIADIRKGGYVLSDCEGVAKVVLIATGSEVELAMKAQEMLKAEGVNARVVSMPSTNEFDKQDAAYKASVLPAGIKRVAIEAGVTDGWYKYVGLDGAVVGLDRFGESAPAPALFKEFGFTPENVVAKVKAVL
jgi:transketolase